MNNPLMLLAGDQESAGNRNRELGLSGSRFQRVLNAEQVIVYVQGKVPNQAELFTLCAVFQLVGENTGIVDGTSAHNYEPSEAEPIQPQQTQDWVKDRIRRRQRLAGKQNQDCHHHDQHKSQTSWT
jgi:hypothetical protein